MTDEKISKEEALELQLLDARIKLLQMQHQGLITSLMNKYHLAPADQVNFDTLVITRTVPVPVLEAV